jgi:hypothetical protein
MTDMTQWTEPRLIELCARCHKYDPKTTKVGELAEEALKELERRGKLCAINKREVDMQLEALDGNAQN